MKTYRISADNDSHTMEGDYSQSDFVFGHNCIQTYVYSSFCCIKLLVINCELSKPIYPRTFKVLYSITMVHMFLLYLRFLFVICAV